MREIKRKRILVVLVLLASTLGLTVCGAITQATQGQSDNRTLSFGEGRFFIDGKVPKGFTEFDYLYLEGGSFKVGPDKKLMVADSPTNLKGEVQGKRRLTFKLKKAAMEGSTLTFESQAVRGVSFQFSGTVFNPAADYNFAEIKGHLEKYLNGKKMAEAEVTFAWLEPTD